MGNLNYPKEECGVFAVFNHPEAANLAYLGLYALQHRGQESAGIAVSQNGSKIRCHKALGLVNEVFSEDDLDKVQGNCAIGHVRYSTTGSNYVLNAQPIVVNYKNGNAAAAHNGNLVNAYELRNELERKGAIFQSSTDSEVIIHLIAHSLQRDFLQVLKEIGTIIKGAFSLVFLKDNKIYAMKDPNGFRPLCVGRLPNGGYAVSSESCAFDIIDAEYLFSVDPGEIVWFDEDGLHRERYANARNHSLCIFEYVYYSRPDSIIYGHNVYSIRKQLGAQLAKEFPVEADLVVPIPDSSIPAAIGYAQEAGVPFELGMIRNHYIGRTFIEPKQQIRDFGAKIKYNAVSDSVKGKRVVVVDDSIVRGTTSKKIIKMLKKRGAAEIHLRISCPPWKYPCYFGIDTPEGEKLIANQMSPDEIADYLDVDSLGYLSLEGLLSVVPDSDNNYCKACFDNVYPVAPDLDVKKEIMETGYKGEKKGKNRTARS